MILFYFFFASVLISIATIITFWRNPFPQYKIAKWVNLIYLIAWLIILTTVKGLGLINVSEQVFEDMIESWILCSYLLLIPNISILIYHFTKKKRLQKAE
ncbi:hypothetical protein LJC69_06535 [Bacteroidales bacterium OttesenSCG-928-K22]|nr:hypothetical protein [Bacteroidales bacterium OttesenSCG-928-K22]